MSLRAFAEAKRYPRLTLLGQSIGSIILAIEAVSVLLSFLMFCLAVEPRRNAAPRPGFEPCLSRVGWQLCR